MATCCLWTTNRRWFLIREGGSFTPGHLRIRTATGDDRSVAPEWIAPFEVTEDQARRWAKDQLGRTLEDLKEGIDEKLAELRQRLEASNRRSINEVAAVTRDAGPALFSLLKQLPGVIGQGLSGDTSRVEGSRNRMTDLQQRLKDAGIDLDERFTRFPDRLAALRREFEERASNASTPRGDTDRSDPDPEER